MAIEDFQQKLKQAWNQFQLTGDINDKGLIKDEVLASWERCRIAGMDAYSKLNDHFISSTELEQRIAKNAFFIDTTSSILKIIEQSLDITGFRFDLFDSDLFLLKQYGDSKAVQLAQHFGVFPGINRKEKFAGTTSISITDDLKMPIQLVGPEHYNINLHLLTCSSTPVLSPNGQYLGILSMSGDYFLFQKHTVGLIAAIGRLITNSMKEKEMLKEQKLLKENLKNIVDAVSDGIIVIDNDNIVITMNMAAGKLFCINPPEIIGKSIKHIFGINNIFSEVLESGQPVKENEIMLEINNKTYRFISNIKKMKNPVGVIGILKPMSSAKSIVKNFYGLKAHFTFEDIIGNSEQIRNIIDLGKNASLVNTIVLLQGESGTGKEVFAQAIHNASHFKKGPFVALNCAAVPAELIESELFGYEDGAFTGARKSGRHGKFELAENGTIFLDEINSMSMPMQTKLLRVIQNRTVTRLGGNNEILINARIICASNKNLWQLVKKGLFREDLFYRIDVLTIDIPPLRKRREDIPLIARYFCDAKGKEFGVEIRLSEEVVAVFCKYDWPGNIRELENVIERGLVMASSRDSQAIEVQDILRYHGISDLFNKGSIGDKGESDNPQSLNLGQMEIDAIKNALKLNNRNLSQTAKSLGISRTTLYRKIKYYDFDYNE